MKPFLTLDAVTGIVLTALAISGAGRADSGERAGCAPLFTIQNPDLRATLAGRDRQRNPEWATLCARHRAAIAGDSPKEF